MENDPKYSPKAAAKYLVVISASWLAKARCSGTGPIFYKPGGRVFYYQSDLDAFLAEHRKTKTSGKYAGKRPGERKAAER